VHLVFHTIRLSHTCLLPVWHCVLKRLYGCVWPDYQRSQCHIHMWTCGKIARYYSCTPGHATPSRAIGRSTPMQTLHGNIHQVDHVPNGPTNSAAITTMFQLRLCGGKLLVAVTWERHYGPSRLRVNDDDDSCAVFTRFQRGIVALLHPIWNRHLQGIYITFVLHESGIAGWHFFMKMRLYMQYGTSSAVFVIHCSGPCSYFYLV